MKKEVIAGLIITLMMSTSVMFTSCGKSVEATVTRVYQPLVSGTVHTWLEVRLDDNSMANVMLPDNDSIWDKARTMKGKKVKIRKQNDKWKFIDFLE